MREPQTTFKAPPRRYQPKGLSILYEDRDILVVDKTSGLLTVSSDKVRENTAYYLLNTYVRKGNAKSRNRVFIVHRLDRDTSGVIVFARHEKAKRYLQAEWHGFKKVYYAVVHGAPPQKEGIITSYLAENQTHRMYSVRDPRKGKLAKTGYRIVRQSQQHSLLEIDLLTGRKNQIRVHLAEAGCPVAGDRKYGQQKKGDGRLALHAASLSIRHPHTKEEMLFTAKVPATIDSLVRGEPRKAGGATS
ncbi:MAG: RluA family pseudouridine synthase [Kiritimatiellia bacterium]|jgi:tRNA pseudouridine32 synthase/23S rRNA pseudouridine746 synthase/23S rRNA pseudouridine1911/1915/1917 synthase|nr:RluA family pseudouridine synthase [Kiritimatiellia bacterium]